MTDPALMSRPATPTASQTLAALNFRYTPSYDTALPDFKPLEPAGANRAAISRPPDPRPAGPVPPDLLPSLPLPAAPRQEEKALPAGQTTRVVFSGEVAPLAPAPLPPVHFAALPDTPPMDPTVFLVGARSAGGEPLLFQQTAPGDAEAEKYARAYLSRLTFKMPPPSPAGEDAAVVIWGWATFYWGNDVYKAAGRK